MTHDELREAAAAAVEESGKTQSDVARELEVHRSAISRALKETGPRVQRLQRRMIRHLTPYRTERRVSYKVHRAPD